MPVATAATFTGIHNENEFYSHHYLSEIFSGDIRADRGFAGASRPTPRAGGRRTRRCERWPATTGGSAATSIASAVADSG